MEEAQAVLVINRAESSDSDLATGEEEGSIQSDLDLRTQSYNAAMESSKSKRAEAAASTKTAVSAAALVGDNAAADNDVKPWETWKGRLARLVIGCFTGFASACAHRQHTASDGMPRVIIEPPVNYSTAVARSPAAALFFWAAVRSGPPLPTAHT